MPNYNKTILMGRLTREPELKTLPSGTTNVSAGIAVNRNWTEKESNEKREEVCFIDLEAFGRNAEIIHDHFNTGSPIHVEGRLRYRAWETSEGEKRSKHDILVDSFQFVESRSESEGKNGNGVVETSSSSDDIPF